MVRTKYCRSCVFRAKANTGEDACRLHSGPQHLHIIDLNKDFCSSHKEEGYGQRCDACGQNRLFEYILLYRDCPDENPPKILCQSCYDKLYTCSSCKSANLCDFETNPIAIPPIVMKTVQQGPMRMQTQIRNPDRVKATCEVNCHCWDPEYGCLKEYGLCGKYEELI